MRFFSLVYLVLFGVVALAQDNDLQIRHPIYDFYDRWEVKSGQMSFSTLKPVSKRKVAGLFDSAEFKLNKVEKFLAEYAIIENREFFNDSLANSKRPIWNTVYKYKNDFLAVKGKDFRISVNPIWELQVGSDNLKDPILFRNGRGFEISGSIDNKLSFFTRTTTNQIQYPAYVQEVIDSVGLIPYEGFWKEYDGTKTDFFRAFGYIDLGLSKHIHAQLGFGRHFLGVGERSMILSDFGNSYPYLRLEAEFWKIRYTSMFAELVADVFTFPGGTLGNSDYPNKFMAFHHIEFNIARGFNIGLFESVILGKPDSLGGSKLEWGYFVPVIFYRAIEQHEGSDNNILLGGDFRWDIYKTARLYGQLVIDEMVISNLVDRNGWWSNKYSYQLGFKYFDLIVDNLDAQVEFNSARPFTYSHDDLFTSYTHYLQPLAHPLGANFWELIGKLNYRPIPRLNLTGTYLFARYGNDRGDEFSVGRDLLKSQLLFENEFGNELTQGIETELSFISLLASYQLKHNFYLDANLTLRNETNITKDNSSTIVSFGFRWNMPYRNYLF